MERFDGESEEEQNNNFAKPAEPALYKSEENFNGSIFALIKYVHTVEKKIVFKSRYSK